MNKTHLCIDALTADIADILAKESGETLTQALQTFMKTKTYALLFDEQSFLYLESVEYIYDMLKAEQRGDWEHWTEV
jgi:hypothetical protein